MERLTITIDGDSSGLTKSLQSAENRLNSFNTRLTNASRGLTNLTSKMATFAASTSAATASFDKVANAANRVDGALGATQSHIASLNRSIQSVITANARMAASFNAATSRINSSTSATNRSAAAARTHKTSTGVMNVGVRDLIMSMTSLNTLLYTSAFLFGGIVKSTIEANSKFERMQVLMKNVSGGANELQKMLIAKDSTNYLWNMADNTPFKIDTLTDTFVKLKAAGIDPTQGSMQALVDTVSYFGGDSEQMKRAGLALSQMLSKGKVTAEELRQQLGDAVPNAMKDMAKALDMTIPELDKKMKKGLVLSADAVPKLMALWEKQYGGAAGRMMDTWDGTMARMSNAWQKTIVRITTDAGSGSLFSVLKSQFSDLSKFMSSQQGDEFLTKLSKGMGDAIKGISDVIKWLYKYRETIMDVAEVLGKLWVAGRFIALGKAVSGSFGSMFVSARSFIGIFPAAVTWITRFVTASSGVKVFGLIFGTNMTKAAAGMGLFTSSLQINKAAVGALIGPYAALIALVGAFGYAAYLQMQKEKASNVASQERTNALKKSETAMYAAKTATEALAVATGDEAVKAKGTVDRLITEANARMTVARSAYAQAKAVAIAAQSKLRVAQDPYATVGGAVKKAGNDSLWNVAGALPVVGPVLKYGGQALFGAVTGRGATEAGGAERLAAQKAEANRKVAEKTMTNELKTLDTLYGGILDKFNHVDPIATPSTPITGDNKGDKEADKLATELEALRDKWVNLRVEKERLDYEIAHGNDDGFKTIDAETRAQAAAKSLIKNAAQAQKAISDMGDSIDLTKQQIKFNSTITAMTNDLKQLQDEAVEARAVFNEDDSLGAKIDVFADKTQKKYAKELADYKGQAERIAQIQKIIADENAAYVDKVSVEAATLIKGKNQELIESMMTESQAREFTYNKARDKVTQLIASLSLLDDKQKSLIPGLQEYLANLDKNNKFQKAGPIAAWSKDAADLNTNLKSGLTNSLTGFIDDLAAGKANFKTFAKSILKDLAAIILKAIIAKAILSALGLGGSPTIGSGAAGSRSDFTNASSGPLAGGYSTSTAINNHTGSIVGSGKGSGYSNVNSRIFDFAQRYHTGGITGLRPDEVPIVAQKGEGVFTADQMKAMGNGNGTGGAAPTINIINQTSQPIDQEQAKPRFDGEKFVIDVILKHANKPGPVRDLIGKK